jgi:acetyl-CoA/propionyl-CoA carboxylase biotin carboxyl carrier protein
VIPFHRKVVDDPAFIGDDATFSIHTSWIETEFDNDIAPYDGDTDADEQQPRETVTVEVGGKRLSVSIPAGLAATGGSAAEATRPAKRRAGKKAGSTASGDTLASPMQGTIVKVAVEDGQHVEAGDLVLVLEAMKMEQPINAHRSGTVTGLVAEVGAAVASGAALCEIKD